MTSPARAAEVRRELARLGRDAGSFDARRYLRSSDGLGFRNVGTGRMRELARRVYRDRDAWSVDEALAFADILIRELIQKAVGWLLREAGKADATRLEHYLRTAGPGIPRTTVRYAIERFEDRTRRELLVATHGRRS